MTEPYVVDQDAQCAQCARCGSSMGFEDCQVCAACGYFDEPDPNCSACHGTGTVDFCLSSRDWCETHPRPGREKVEPGTAEWYQLLSDGSTRLSGGWP